MVSDKEIEAAVLEVLKLRGAEVGGCFRPDNIPQGECADGDCYCSRQGRREAEAALSAAARVRAEDTAETLIDTMSEEVWNHDASQDNCNVIDKDDLTNTDEPVEGDDVIAILKAENEKLRKDNKVLQTEACRAWGLMKETAERALAERAGGVNEDVVAHAYVIDGECEQIKWGADADLPDDPSLVLLYTRPTEQAATEAMERFEKIAEIIRRNLFHQQEKISDARQIAIEGAEALKAAMEARR